MKAQEINIKPNSEEWKAWRREGIGASDIGVIMGSNPYQTPYELWMKKCGFREEDKDNTAMQHGRAFEPVVRYELKEKRMWDLKEKCLEHATVPIFRASLDGWEENKQLLVEIKAPVSEKILDKAIFQKVFPQYWLDQVQWQMLVAGCETGYLAVWDFRQNEIGTVVEILPNKERQKEMEVKALEFWGYVESGQRPPLMTKDVVDFNEKPDVQEAIEEYKFLLLEMEGLLEKLKPYEDRLKEVKQKLYNFANGHSYEVNEFKITAVSPSYTYDYKKMELDGIPVERYRKIRSDKISYRITESKK